MVTIRIVETEQEKAQISDLADHTLGLFYVFEEEILDRAIVAKWDDIITGFVLTDFYEIYDPDCDSVGLIDTVAVHPQYQGNGIATLLISAACMRLSIQGAALIETYAWKDFNGIHLRKPLIRNDFAEIEWFPNFWKNMPFNGFECATCGHPCSCTAVLYRKEINKNNRRKVI